MTTRVEQMMRSDRGRELLCEELTITNVTNLIASLLNFSGMSRSDFARQLKVTPGRVTQILDGKANMKLSTIARALAAFDQVLWPECRSIGDFAGPLNTIDGAWNAWSGGVHVLENEIALSGSQGPLLPDSDSPFGIAA